MDGTSLSDIAAVVRGNEDSDGWGGGAWWIIVLFLFMFGNGWNKTNGDPITEAGLCNAMNFNNLENAVGRMSDQNQMQTSTITSGISDLGYALQNSINAIGKENALGQSNISQQIASCCCETQRAIESVNYNAANNTAAINANTTAAVQKVLDTIQQDKIDTLQAQVNQLQLETALCGVVRYPNATTYTAGYNPYYRSCACSTSSGSTTTAS